MPLNIETRLTQVKASVKKIFRQIPRGAAIHTVEAAWHFAHGNHLHAAAALGFAALSVLHARH